MPFLTPPMTLMGFELTAQKQLSGYHARDPGFHSRSRHTRVNPGSFQPNIMKQPQTTIINDLVYPRYTYNSQYTINVYIMIGKCQYNQHTPYLQQYEGVVTS